MEEQTEIILKITKSKHDEWSKFAKKEEFLFMSMCNLR